MHKHCSGSISNLKMGLSIDTPAKRKGGECWTYHRLEKETYPNTTRNRKEERAIQCRRCILFVTHQKLLNTRRRSWNQKLHKSSLIRNWFSWDVFVLSRSNAKKRERDQKRTQQKKTFLDFIGGSKTNSSFHCRSRRILVIVKIMCLLIVPKL